MRRVLPTATLDAPRLLLIGAGLVLGPVLMAWGWRTLTRSARLAPCGVRMAPDAT